MPIYATTHSGYFGQKFENSNMKSTLIVIFIFLIFSDLNASPQVLDYVMYKNDAWITIQIQAFAAG